MSKEKEALEREKKILEHENQTLADGVWELHKERGI